MELNKFPIPTEPPQMRTGAEACGPPPPRVESSNPNGQPPEGLRRTRYLLGSAVALVTLGAIAAYFGLVSYFDNDQAAVADRTPVVAATEFLEAERIGDLETMESLASNSEKCFGSGSRERLRSIANKLDFKAFNLELPGSPTAGAEAQTESAAVVRGVVDIGYVTSIVFAMVAESDQWKVCGFSIE